MSSRTVKVYQLTIFRNTSGFGLARIINTLGNIAQPADFEQIKITVTDMDTAVATHDPAAAPSGNFIWYNPPRLDGRWERQFSEDPGYNFEYNFPVGSFPEMNTYRAEANLLMAGNSVGRVIWQGAPESTVPYGVTPP